MGTYHRADFGWSYPPGVSGADIDRQSGDVVTGECECGGDLFDGQEECDTCVGEIEAEYDAKAKAKGEY